MRAPACTQVHPRFPPIAGFSWIFLDIPRYSWIFQGIPRYSKIFPIFWHFPIRSCQIKSDPRFPKISLEISVDFPTILGFANLVVKMRYQVGPWLGSNPCYCRLESPYVNIVTPLSALSVLLQAIHSNFHKITNARVRARRRPPGASRTPRAPPPCALGPHMWATC